MVKCLRWSGTLRTTCLSSALLAAVVVATLAEDVAKDIDSEDLGRARRSASPINHEEGGLLMTSQGLDTRDKKAPRGFMGLRGKKMAHSGFLGMRGRRLNLEEGPAAAEGDLYTDASSSPSSGVRQEVSSPEFPFAGDVMADQEKRASGGYYTFRGKKLPSGFMGLRGKKVPYGFMGLRGKKAPSYFMGLRGKKDDSPSYDDLESLLQAMRFRYRNNYLNAAGVDKRAPQGFMGLRGKKSDDYNDASDYDNSNDVTYGIPPIGFSPLYERRAQTFDKRVPRGF